MFLWMKRGTTTFRAICGLLGTQPLDIGVLLPENDNLSYRRNMEYSANRPKHKMCRTVNRPCMYTQPSGAAV